MKTSNFEAVKVALKQDKSGFILTLSMHPDDVPEEILRDFVGARYQVVIVRLGSDERPMNREQEYAHDATRMAGMMCRELAFHTFLHDGGHIFLANEEEATDWLKKYLDVQSRSEIKDNANAQQKLRGIYQEFQSWKTTA